MATRLIARLTEYSWIRDTVILLGASSGYCQLSTKNRRVLQIFLQHSSRCGCSHHNKDWPGLLRLKAHGRRTLSVTLHHETNLHFSKPPNLSEPLGDWCHPSHRQHVWAGNSIARHNTTVTHPIEQESCGELPAEKIQTTNNIQSPLLPTTKPFQAFY